MDVWDSVLRMASSLAIVLALMMGLLVVARRLLTRGGFVQAGQPLVRVLGTGYLGPRKSISLVSVAGELLIIGTTGDAIVPLGRLGEPTRAVAAVQGSGGASASGAAAGDPR
ncbi:FliO/MopB family protein [Candidatus Nitrospira bockiana]